MEGKDYHSMKPEELRKHIVMVPQQVNLFSGTIRENLLLADLFLQLEGQVLFLKFPAEAVDQGGFVHPAREDAVFQKLLGDGAGSLVEAAGSKTVNAARRMRGCQCPCAGRNARPRWLRRHAGDPPGSGRS